MATLNHDELRNQIALLLSTKPREDAPDNFWDNGDIRTTWTGIWLDAYGEWDEMPASEVYPITYFLSEKIEALFIEKIMQIIATHDQQLLEAVLGGADYGVCTGGEWSNEKKRFVCEHNHSGVIPVEHIKSVFGKEGE